MRLFRRAIVAAPAAITAAVDTPEHGINRSTFYRGGATLDNTKEIDDYDRYGPGFVGAYLDLMAEQVAKAGLHPQRSIGGHRYAPLSPEHEAIARGVWRRFQGEYQSEDELLRRIVRLRLKHGECWLLVMDDGHLVVASTQELKWGSNQVGWNDPRNPNPSEVEWIPATTNRVIRLWRPDDTNPRLPSSELLRALPHVREWIAAKRRQNADARSRLVANDMLVFGTGTEAYNGPREAMNGLPQIIVDYLELADTEIRHAYHSLTPASESVPFPAVGDAPELVKIGRDIDPMSFSLEKSSLANFARSVRVPQKLLEEGPGNAKYNNEEYVWESLVEQAISPLAMEIGADLVRGWYRQLLRATVEFMGSDLDPDSVALVPDLDRLRARPDNVAQMLEAWRNGIVGRASVANALDEPLFVLPPGMSDMDMWREMRRVAGSGVQTPQGGGQATANIMVQGKQPSGHPEVSGHSTTASAALPGLPHLEQMAPAELSPVVIVAAAQDPRQDALDTLTAIDRRVFATLQALGGATIREAISDVGRLLTRALPNTAGARRRELTDIADPEKWAALTQDERTLYGIDLDKIIVASAVLKRAERQATDELERELPAIAAAVLALGGERISRDNYPVEEAAKRWRQGITAVIAAAFVNARQITAAPSQVTRMALTIAGGGQRDASGVLRPFADPIWLGADGFAAGASTGAEVQRTNPGLHVRFQWEWAMYGEPDTPYEPHLGLSGAVRGSVDPRDWEGFFPQDHHGCRCGFKMLATTRETMPL